MTQIGYEDMDLIQLKTAIESFLRERMGIMCGSSEHVSFAEMGVDSMAVLKILLFLEKEFDIYLPDSKLTYENVKSPDTLARAALSVSCSRGG